MTRAEFLDEFLETMRWSGWTGQRLTRRERLTREELDGVGGILELRTALIGFWTFLGLRINPLSPANRPPGIPGLARNGVALSLSAQAGHDLAMYLSGRWAEFPAAAWGDQLAVDMKARADAIGGKRIAVVAGQLRVVDGETRRAKRRS